LKNAKDEYTALRDDDWKKIVTLFVSDQRSHPCEDGASTTANYIKNNNKAREDFQVNEFALDSFATMAHHDRSEEVESRDERCTSSVESCSTGSMIMDHSKMIGLFQY